MTESKDNVLTQDEIDILLSGMQYYGLCSPPGELCDKVFDAGKVKDSDLLPKLLDELVIASDSLMQLTPTRDPDNVNIVKMKSEVVSWWDKAKETRTASSVFTYFNKGLMFMSALDYLDWETDPEINF